MLKSLFTILFATLNFFFIEAGVLDFKRHHKLESIMYIVAGVFFDFMLWNFTTNYVPIEYIVRWLFG